MQTTRRKFLKFLLAGTGVLLLAKFFGWHRLNQAAEASSAIEIDKDMLVKSGKKLTVKDELVIGEAAGQGYLKIPVGTNLYKI